MTVTRSDIAQGLRALGVSVGNVLFVHSSVKSSGRVDGGADMVIDALLEVVGPSVTVMVPTITGTAEHSPANPPVFDVRNTPCCRRDSGDVSSATRRGPQLAPDSLGSRDRRAC